MAAAMIRAATPADIPAIHRLIVELAIYEKEPDAVKATHDDLARALFGERPVAECVLAEQDDEAVGIALFFTNFSTWTGKPGLYLEDLFVMPSARGRVSRWRATMAASNGACSTGTRRPSVFIRRLERN